MWEQVGVRVRICTWLVITMEFPDSLVSTRATREIEFRLISTKSRFGDALLLGTRTCLPF